MARGYWRVGNLNNTLSLSSIAPENSLEFPLLCYLRSFFFSYLDEKHLLCLGALMLLLDFSNFLSPVSHMICHSNYKLFSKCISLYPEIRPEISGGLILTRKTSFIFEQTKTSTKIHNWSNFREQGLRVSTFEILYCIFIIFDKFMMCLP